jgi:hypothetical protein
MDFISVAAAAAAAAADFIPRVAMSRRRDICVCARAYTVLPGRRRAGVGGGRGRGVSRVTRASARAAFGLLVFSFRALGFSRACFRDEESWGAADADETRWGRTRRTRFVGEVEPLRVAVQRDVVERIILRWR